MIDKIKSLIGSRQVKRKPKSAMLDKVERSLNKRVYRDEKLATYEDLVDYEKAINDIIRDDDDYQCLHDKVILVSAMGLTPTLYYYCDRGERVVVGEWRMLSDGNNIVIRSEFKSM